VTRPRLLSKSRFKEAWGCPTTLYYTGKPQFGNARADDAFMRALADGGFQVGALARHTYPQGVLIETLDAELALAQTQALLARDSVVIFEAAVRHGSLFARVDVLVKRGDALHCIEVKAKSFHSREDSFFTKRGKQGKPAGLTATWAEYVADVGFQQLICERAYPLLRCVPFLLLVDKSALCSVDGLHQHFLLRRTEGRTQVVVRPGLSVQAMGTAILTCQDATAAVAALDALQADGTTFAQRVDALATAYVTDTLVPPTLSTSCRTCAYRIDARAKAQGLRSGFDACWTAASGLSAAELESEPLVIDRGRLDVPDLLQRGIYRLADVSEEDVGPQPDKLPGHSDKQRLWLRVSKLAAHDSTVSVDRDELAAQMSTWRYPLHMIDFETVSPAIPFHRGKRPYAQLAFQFSHHTVQANGEIAHAGEYLQTQPGAFPNYEFVRALRTALSTDSGSVFRYWHHENTVLCDIMQQLQDSETPPDDSQELIAWLRTLTRSPGKSDTPWCGERNMIDMGWVVKRFHYDPLTQGSNSLKYVLPAVLARSAHLQEKYQRPVYGAQGGIASLNYRDWAWIRYDAHGKLRDPYKLLPLLFDVNDDAVLERVYGEEEIREGGAAMTAYARMQFTEMSELERSQVGGALKKYCELDTFAMVLLYEYWRTLVDS
jgi:hypothetical protein